MLSHIRMNLGVLKYHNIFQTFILLIYHPTVETEHFRALIKYIMNYPYLSIDNCLNCFTKHKPHPNFRNLTYLHRSDNMMMI